jgi:hypothetical protein
MRSNNTTDSISISRRRFLRGISASGLLLTIPRAMALESALPSLRELAGGKPLMGTSLQTQ